jgi:hypothetical protein
MRNYLVAAVLIGALATPALAVETGGGKYFVGFDTNSKTCSHGRVAIEGIKRSRSVVVVHSEVLEQVELDVPKVGAKVRHLSLLA